MTNRAEKLRRYCVDQKVGFKMNKNAKVTVKEFDLAICVPWKCASQYVKHTMKTFKEESGLNTTSTKCGLSYDRQKRSEETKCKEIQKDFDNPNEWSMGEIAESPTTSRVLVVRHPFVRLISAWNDKLLTSNLQSWPMYRTFRMARFNKEQTTTHRITFVDFVEYLAYAMANTEIINRHFQPQSGMCDPCVSNYNHVLKVERLKLDMNALLQKHDLQDHSVNETYHDQEGGFGSRPLSEVVTMVKEHLQPLSSDRIKLLYDYYKYDFLAFDYTFNFKTLEVGGF